MISSVRAVSPQASVDATRELVQAVGIGSGSLCLGLGLRYYGLDRAFSLAGAFVYDNGAASSARRKQETLPYLSATFDAVVAMQADEHISPGGLFELWRVCRPNGRLLVVTRLTDATSAAGEAQIAPSALAELKSHARRLGLRELRTERLFLATTLGEHWWCYTLWCA